MRFNFEWYDLRAFSQNERNARLIEKLYDDAIREASRLAVTVNRVPGAVFSFRDFPALNKRIEDLFRELASKVQATISNGTLEAWALGNAKNDALLSYLHKSTGIAKDILAARYKWGARNEEALKAFQNRKTAGMNLSQRVWNYTRQAKADIESAIDVALGEGTNAAALSRQIRKHLNEPDRLFRRVREKGGRLRLSRAAKSYHPGQGVYRSSFKNSMRLARNEINMAYRESDHLRWSQMDFVKGVQVKLSNNPNHCPLCAKLAGVYPKDFAFKSWHPQCRCFAIPILATNAEFEKLLSDPEYKLPGQVQSLPEGAKSWYRDNTDKIKRAKSVPYFFADNKKFFQGSKAPASAINLGDFIKGSTVKNGEARAVMQEVARIRPEWFRNGLEDIKFTRSGSYMMQHSMKYRQRTNEWVSGSKLSISTNTFTTIGFNPADEFKGALEALKGGKALTFKQEYAMESMWHEILHARTKSAPVDLSKAKLKAMETVNQFTARHTYNEFLELLGGKAAHKKKILDDGYGYASWIKDFRKRLKDAGISESKALKELRPVLFRNYAEVEKAIEELFKKHGKQT